MIGSTMPSSDSRRRSRITMSCTTSSTEPESMHTCPTVTLPALRAPWWSNSRTSPYVHDEGLFQTGEAQVLGQLGVLGKLPELPVNGHEVARPHQVQYQLHLFHATVSGDMEGRIHAAVQDVGAAARHVVDHRSE